MLDTRILGFHSDCFISLHQSNGRCATNKYFQIIGSIHDIESYSGIDNTSSLNVSIFFSHNGHLAIIFVWVSTHLFHIGWNGNYSVWVFNPIATIPIAHGISDPHFALPINYSSGKSDYTIVLSYSGIYNWLYTLGFNSVFHLYNFVMICELLAVISIPLGKVHLIYLEDTLQWCVIVGFTLNLELLCATGAMGLNALAKDLEIIHLHKKLALDIKVGPIFIWPFKLFVAYFDLGNLRLNFHTGIIIGFLSIAWCGHLVHVAIPISRGIQGVYWSISLYPFYTGNWVLYSLDIDNSGCQWFHLSHRPMATCMAAKAIKPCLRPMAPILTFLGGLKSNTISLYLTDIAHHHLGVGILFVWASHVYLSLYKGFACGRMWPMARPHGRPGPMGHRIRDVFFVNGNSGPMIPPLGKSVDLQLSLALGGSCVITSVVAQDIYSLTPYLYLSYDYIILVALYVHHSWIASFLMMGSFAHAGIFLIRDYTINMAAFIRPKQEQDVIYRILAHKGAIISHLSWICLWLGFHTLGLYIHNDTIVAFGEQEKQILIEPVFGQIIQESYCQSFDSFIIPLGPGDLLAHHAIALGLHVSILILLKGSLDGCGSKLMPDKIHFGYGFACDGPGRGGTCDISAWDSFYLATFWMLNTGAWITFYFHWKHLTLSQNTVFQFSESSTTMNGWFRDYLWFNSTPLIHAYNTFGGNDLSIWAWAFLGAHLAWATGFMFLISWRGYWQELISIILSMHERTPILYNLWIGDIYTPVALSILQARFVGLVHFSTGFILTYPPFIIGATT